MKKYAILHTLGCRLNSADSALLVDRLEKAGYSVVQSADSVDLVVVNSCTVTAEAVRKSRQAVRKFRASYPGALIVVTGCSAELDRDAYLKDGAASVVLSNPEKRGISELILDYLAGRHELGGKAASLNEPVQAFHEEAISRFPFRSRAFLKIQEGCNNFCSYCIVPYARGPERSRSFDEVLADCRQAVAAGYPELVLTGVNTCAYFDAGRDLGALVREVCRIDGNFRVRLSSTEPHPHNIGLLEVMASEPKVCRYLHLALQNGCNRILKAMNRHYRREDYAEFARIAREKIPGIHLGSDLILGFPGETEEDFADGLAFVEQMAFANLHIFTYSPRSGTPAASLPGRIPPEVAKLRYRKLKEVAEASRRKFVESQLGQVLPVIFETVGRDGLARGWSDNYLAVRVPAGSVELGTIVDIAATPENLGGAEELHE